VKRRLALALPLALVLPTHVWAQAQVDGFRFGVLRPLGGGVYDFGTETSRLPLRLRKSGFRWGVHFVNPGGVEIAWYEVIRLKAVAPQSGDKPVPADSVVLRTPVKKTSDRVIVDDFWFDETDRPGAYSLDLFVDGTLRWTASFDVVQR
jgi:hypothetical protein